MDFWRQVGKENGAKIDPRRHRKSDGKVDSIKMAKKSQQDVLTRRETRGPDLGRSPLLRRDNPLGPTGCGDMALKSSKVLYST